jgi:DNA repair protein RadC
MTLLAPILLPSRLDDPAAAERLFAPLADQPVEVMVFVYLAADQRVLGMRQTRSSEADLIDLRLRDIAVDALTHDAAGVVMAHNHPSGDPTPSRDDHEATRRIARALETLGIRLLDHVIVARGGSTSFRKLGLL